MKKDYMISNGAVDALNILKHNMMEEARAYCQQYGLVITVPTAAEMDGWLSDMLGATLATQAREHDEEASSRIPADARLNVEQLV